MLAWSCLGLEAGMPAALGQGAPGCSHASGRIHQRQARGLLPVGFGLLRASVEAERGETESNGQERLHADTDLCHPTKRCCMCFLSMSAQPPQRRELPPAKQRTLSVCMGSRGHWCALWGLLLRESGALAEKMQGGNEGELNSGEA